MAKVVMSVVTGVVRGRQGRKIVVVEEGLTMGLGGCYYLPRGEKTQDAKCLRY